MCLSFIAKFLLNRNAGCFWRLPTMDHPNDFEMRRQFEITSKKIALASGYFISELVSDLSAYYDSNKGQG